MNHTENIAFICANPLVPVFFDKSIDKSIAILQASYDAGIRVFEFTNRGAEAPEVYAALSRYKNENCKDLKLGIGTIVDAKTAHKYIEIGVDFIVQPGLTEEVAEVCQKNNIMWIPGVLTPTEIYKAQYLGAEMVKIFPASVMGSAYIKALRGPMPNLKIMVTGGVEPTEASLNEWFGAGANVLGLGSQLFKNVDDINVFQKNIQDLISIFNLNYKPT